MHPSSPSKTLNSLLCSEPDAINNGHDPVQNLNQIRMFLTQQLGLHLRGAGALTPFRF